MKQTKARKGVDAQLAEAAKAAGLTVDVVDKFGAVALYKGDRESANVVGEAFWAAKGYKDRRTTKRSDAFKFLIRAIVGVKF